MRNILFEKQLELIDEWMFFSSGAFVTIFIKKHYLIIFLAEHYANGYLNESSFLWSEGRTDWMPLSSIPELFSGVKNQGPNLQNEGK